MEGLSVCQYFFSFTVLLPDEVRSRDMCSPTSSSFRLGTATTLLFPFTAKLEMHSTAREIDYPIIPPEDYGSKNFANAWW